MASDHTVGRVIQYAGVRFLVNASMAADRMLARLNQLHIVPGFHDAVFRVVVDEVGAQALVAMIGADIALVVEVLLVNRLRLIGEDVERQLVTVSTVRGDFFNTQHATERILRICDGGLGEAGNAGAGIGRWTQVPSEAWWGCGLGSQRL